MKNQLKHILSIILAIALLLASVPAVLNVSADTAAVPGVYIKNGTFSTGDLSNWTVNGGATCFSASTEQKDVGSYSLKASGQADKYLSQNISVEPNTDYTVFFRSYISSGTDTNNGSVYAMDADWSAKLANEKYISGSTGAWQNNNYTFNSGNRTQVVIIVRLIKGTVYFDRFFIKKRNNLLNYGDFPVGFINGWGSLVNSDAIQSDNAVGTEGYCLYKTGTNDTNTRQTVTVTANTKYILTFYSKRAASGSYPFLKVTKSDNWNATIAQVGGSSTTGWQKKSYLFDSGSNTSIVLFLMTNSGNAYFDNISLVEAVSASVNATEGGTVSCSDIVSDYLEKGSKTTVIATPDGEHTFYGWYDENERRLVSKDASYTFTPTDAVDLTAKFYPPEVKTHSLALGDSIRLNFFMDLSMLTSSDMSGSYMTFVISNGTSKTAAFDDEFLSEVGDYYGFACPLSSVGMAETVTPTYHYTLGGVSKTVECEPYSVKAYIDYVNANSGSFASNVVNLVNAIGNYGYYAQQYFTSKTFTALDSDYIVSGYNTAEAYANRKTYTADKAITDHLSGIVNGGAVGQFQYSLNLDSTTSILVKFNTANVNFTVTKAGVDYEDRKNAYTANDCTLYILHFPISQLGDNIVVSGKVNGNDYSMEISGLTYVYGVLDNGDASTSLKNLACALCDYYTLAIAYANGIPITDYLSGDYM